MGREESLGNDTNNSACARRERKERSEGKVPYLAAAAAKVAGRY